MEERLAVMLSSLLGLEQVSVHDNFFMLGGHSLLGTQLISQIRGAFGVELALRTLFESPTIEQLSLEIERLLMAQVEAMSEEEVAADAWREGEARRKHFPFVIWHFSFVIDAQVESSFQTFPWNRVKVTQDLYHSMTNEKCQMTNGKCSSQ